MLQKRAILRDGLIAICLVGSSFGFGWLAFDRYHADSRRVSFNFTPPYVIPGKFEPIGLQSTPENVIYAVGDRIDVLVSADGIVEPLILDGIVYSSTKTNFGILVPLGGRALLDHARHKGFEILYRPSVVVTEAAFPAAASKGQGAVEHLQGKRQSETGG